MINAILDAMLGVTVTCLAGYAANRLGWIEVRVGKRTSDLGEPSSRARLTYSITVEERSDSGPALGPLRLFAILTNKGSSSACKLRGHWKLFAAGPLRPVTMLIVKESLAPGDQFLDSCLVEAVEDWETHGIHFDAELEFEYLSPPNDEVRRVQARYRYDGIHQTMVKLNAAT